MLFGEHATCQAEAEYPELWQGLVGAWSPCLSPRGWTVLRDLSGRGNHGTLTNMDPATDWVTSNGKGALDFPGLDEYISLSTSPNLPGQSTISAWVVPDTNTGLGHIFGNYNSAANTSQYGLEINRSGGRFSGLANGNFVGVTSGTNIVLGALYHVVLIRSGVAGAWTMQFVINGRLDGSASTAKDPQALQTTSIGRAGAWNSAYFNGRILDVIASTRAMAHTEAALMYRLGPGGWATPRRRRWNYATAQTAIPYWVFARKNARLIGGGVS